MNIVTFLLSTGLNLLHVPFAENIRDERSSVSNSETSNSESFFPFSLFRNTPACSTINLALGENNIKFSTLPRGFCTNCCPVKISRDVQFRLYNKEEQQNGIPILPLNQKGAAKMAGVRRDWNTVIFIHGFSEISPGESGRAIVDAYLSRPENYNIILLDWGELASLPWYRVAVQNVKLVGQILKNFIKLYNQTGEIPVQNLHVIGFSLGCHIASVAGKELKWFKIPRITALDPAFPEYSLEDRTKRLVESDADYVDVIHTDAGIFGFPESIGDADFYPNGGKALQPGCQPSYLAEQRIVDQVLACSHIRAWKLYAESVRNPDAFPANRCRNWKGVEKGCNFTIDAYMGFKNKYTFGQFFLRTGFKPPYALNFPQQASDQSNI